MLLPALYNALWRIAPPLIRHYLRKRTRKNPAYLEHWNERFGEPLPNPVQQPIWIHAVSVGETRAAQPLIAELQRRFPDAPLLLTQMTPTGRATAAQLYPQAQCRYLPYDRRDWVAQFLREHRPQFGILMETEIWANLISGCHKNHIPLFLANARLSEKSQRSYQKIPSLIRPALRQLTAICAQTPADAQRLQQLGAPNPIVCGNTKYDIPIPPASRELAAQFRQKIGNRRVFLAASLREKDGQDEAELILNAWHNTDALLIIIPRHPERFQAAYELAQQRGFKTQKRSDNTPIQPDTQVWIGDSMGEMYAYFQAADIVFIGGSLVDTGCQNIIEPLQCGKPVLFGPSIYNFQAACQEALSAGVAQQIHSASELVQTVTQQLTQPEIHTQQASRAAEYLAQHRGASQRIANVIEQHLKTNK
nr:lipid IV(A) 3-deoxy-D-manno-octulosonic acid transferase [uncultured Kingella sp.]